MICKIHAHSYDELDDIFPDSIKKTHQRLDILRILYHSKTPLSAAEIYEKLNSEHKDNGYAFSTIYRSLSAFEKAGTIVKTVLTTEDNAVYEYRNETHKHYAVCLKCHKKIPISTCPMHDIIDELAKSIPGFKVTGHQMELTGYCENCSKQ
ncbi:Fur family transcriptional regulator [Butyrivibrio proteoclasticus]|uniref:Fur family transcriptional regulator n=1 Tax=Butyrivibrio proteoclasticus TaxID=43305 RepID=UPI00068594CA|nr:transcriptional repressor [Butyrivibrio proteoclasticus]